MTGLLPGRSRSGPLRCCRSCPRPQVVRANSTTRNFGDQRVKLSASNSRPRTSRGPGSRNFRDHGHGDTDEIRTGSRDDSRRRWRGRSASDRVVPRLQPSGRAFVRVHRVCVLPRRWQPTRAIGYRHLTNQSSGLPPRWIERQWQRTKRSKGRVRAQTGRVPQTCWIAHAMADEDLTTRPAPNRLSQPWVNKPGIRQPSADSPQGHSRPPAPGKATVPLARDSGRGMPSKGRRTPPPTGAIKAERLAESEGISSGPPRCR